MANVTTYYSPAVIIAEISSLRLRDKTAFVGWSTQNVTNFVLTFTLPYLSGPAKPTAGLGAKVAFIYGFIGWCGVIWAYFYAPELKGRSLEEIDEMLRAGVSARKSKGSYSAKRPYLGQTVTDFNFTAWQSSQNSMASRNTQFDDNKDCPEHKETA